MQRETKQSFTVSLMVHGGFIFLALMFLFVERWLQRRSRLSLNWFRQRRPPLSQTSPNLQWMTPRWIPSRFPIPNPSSRFPMSRTCQNQSHPSPNRNPSRKCPMRSGRATGSSRNASNGCRQHGKSQSPPRKSRPMSASGWRKPFRPSRFREPTSDRSKAPTSSNATWPTCAGVYNRFFNQADPACKPRRSSPSPPMAASPHHVSSGPPATPRLTSPPSGPSKSPAHRVRPRAIPNILFR